jgi:chorismate mutase-like protein
MRLLLAFSVLTVAGPVIGEQARDTVRVLRVGSTGDYPPFSYRNPATGEWSGADIDMARSLGRALGRPVEFVPTSWRSLVADQVAGRFDIAMGGISVTPERALQVSFTAPYLTDGKAPLVRCTDVVRYAELADIDQPAVRVVVNPGGTNEQFVRQQLRRAQVTVHADNIGVFDELLAGRADVMITDAIEARLQQQLRPALCAVRPQQPFNEVPKAYMMSKDSPLRPALEHWLATAMTQGEVIAALERALNQPWPGATPPTPAQRLALLIDQRLALMPFVARYKWNRQLAIEDAPRERQLLLQVREMALAKGVDPARAEAFFAAQMAAAKVVQSELYAVWRAQVVGQLPGEIDLAARIRPRLDELNASFLEALAAVQLPVSREGLGPLSAEAQSPGAVATALAPLLEPRPVAP